MTDIVSINSKEFINCTAGSIRFYVRPGIGTY